MKIAIKRFLNKAANEATNEGMRRKLGIRRRRPIAMRLDVSKGMT